MCLWFIIARHTAHASSAPCQGLMIWQLWDQTKSECNVSFKIVNFKIYFLCVVLKKTRTGCLSWRTVFVIEVPWTTISCAPWLNKKMFLCCKLFIFRMDFDFVGFSTFFPKAWRENGEQVQKIRQRILSVVIQRTNQDCIFHTVVSLEELNTEISRKG